MPNLLGADSYHLLISPLILPGPASRAVNARPRFSPPTPRCR